MKYYLINEMQFENYKLSLTFLNHLMEEGKIPYKKEVKEAFDYAISRLEQTEVYLENEAED